jgi:protease I
MLPFPLGRGGYPRVDTIRGGVHGREEARGKEGRDPRGRHVRARRARRAAEGSRGSGRAHRRRLDFDPAKTIKVDRTVEEVTVDDYDALLIPGGVGNPDQLRGDENAVNFVRDFARARKPMAVICHGPWMLVEAGVARGLTLTSWPTLQTDIRNAGGTWVDQEVVVDGGIVTSRKPDDIPAFNKKMIEEFCEGRHDRDVTAINTEATAT